MYIKVELTREQALEVLRRGSALAFASHVEESDEFMFDNHVSELELLDYGLVMIRNQVYSMDDGRPQMYHSPKLKKKEYYYTDDLDCLAGNEEEVLNTLLLEEMKSLPSDFYSLDHQTTFRDNEMSVGCQTIPKKDAIGIANYILEYYGK